MGVSLWIFEEVSEFSLFVLNFEGKPYRQIVYAFGGSIYV